MRIASAVVMTLMVLALISNVAAADEGSNPDVVPYDPGLPGDQLPPLPPPPWPFTE